MENNVLAAFEKTAEVQGAIIEWMKETEQKIKIMNGQINDIQELLVKIMNVLPK